MSPLHRRVGDPIAVKNPFGQVTKICYNVHNAPVTVTVANGIVTEYSYNDAGCVTRIVRRDGSDVLSSLGVAYDAAGRLVREGDKTYTYGYLDKVLSVTENDRTITDAYHPDGQLASANYGDKSETFAWDGLALIQRGDERFVNEPHIGGGNPVASSKGTTYFNDMLGTTVGSKSNDKYSAAALTAFGEGTDADKAFFTGKPMVEGLGHAFWMRNYRAGLAKWQTADPMGYPDGWNQLAYCNNGVTSAVDLWGCEAVAYRDIYENFVNTLISLNSVDALDKESSRSLEAASLRLSRLVPMTDRSITVVHYDWRKVDPEVPRVRNGVTEYLYERCDDTWVYAPYILQVKASGEIQVEYWERTVAGGGVVGIAIPALGIATGIASAVENVIKKVLTVKLEENEWLPVGVVFSRKRDEYGNFVITHNHKTKYME